MLLTADSYFSIHLHQTLGTAVHTCGVTQCSHITLSLSPPKLLPQLVGHCINAVNNHLSSHYSPHSHRSSTHTPPAQAISLRDRPSPRAPTRKRRSQKHRQSRPHRTTLGAAITERADPTPAHPLTAGASAGCWLAGRPPHQQVGVGRQA